MYASDQLVLLHSFFHEKWLDFVHVKNVLLLWNPSPSPLEPTADQYLSHLRSVHAILADFI